MDRLSELPDSILLHILSFLRMKDVVRTAILSKRLQHLWTIVQELDFDLEGFFQYQNFVDFVNRTLLSRGTSKIRRLRIDLFLPAASCKDYDGWICYAAKSNVEQLFLDFDSDGCSHWCVPRCVFCISSLKTLRLFSCRFMPRVQISWNSLTKLTLRYSLLFDEDVRKILVGAPKLEFFELKSCFGYHDLNFDSPSLRTVFVDDRESDVFEDEFESDVFEDGPIMRISAPNVQSLRLSGSLYRKCVLMNVTSIVHGTVNFRPYTGLHRDKNLKQKQDNLIEIVRRLKHVDSLTLGSWCVEVLALREKRHLPSQISTHKCVTLGTYMREDDLLGTVNLLKGSPALQMLIIDMQFGDELDLADAEDSCNSNGANYLASQAKHVGCLHHLKTVKITQFVAKSSIFSFLEFILKYGMVLENLVIVPKREDANLAESLLKVAERLQNLNANSPESLLKVAQRLLNLPRASSRAVVTLLN